MKKKILVIENDDGIRGIVEMILSGEGFETLSMTEPQSFAEILQFKPDLILVDEFINNKPGHRLCLRIKHEPLLTHIPVIILSTLHHIELIAKECNANDYISKPFDVKVMVDKVMRVIDEKPLEIN